MIDFRSDDLDWVIECYENYVHLLELHRDYYWVIDRFHISTISHQQMRYGRAMQLEWVDERLRELGFVLVHCWRDPTTFAAAREHRLTYSENPNRYDDLDVFVAEQEVMSGLVANSKLPSLTIDVSDGDIDRIAGDVIQWMKEIGAFWWQG